MGITIWQIILLLVLIIAIISIVKLFSKNNNGITVIKQKSNSAIKHNNPTESNTKAINYYNAHSKSQVSGFLLTLLFGPLGLFYSNWILAIIYSIAAIAGLTTIVLFITMWVLSIITSAFTIHSYNSKIRSTADLLS